MKTVHCPCVVNESEYIHSWSQQHVQERYFMMIERTEVEPQHRQNMWQRRRMNNKKP